MSTNCSNCSASGAVAACETNRAPAAADARQRRTDGRRRFDYGYRLVGVSGVAQSQGFKVLVRVYQALDLGGALLDAHWTLELEAQAEAQYATLAVDALLAFAAHLAPLVDVGTIDAKALSEARNSHAAFRAVVAATAL